MIVSDIPIGESTIVVTTLDSNTQTVIDYYTMNVHRLCKFIFV